MKVPKVLRVGWDGSVAKPPFACQDTRLRFRFAVATPRLSQAWLLETCRVRTGSSMQSPRVERSEI